MLLIRSIATYSGLWMTVAATSNAGFIAEFRAVFDAWCKEDDNVAEFM